ncbi:MAG: sigma-70 family RNA polymerase sigma factor [Clostridia bacterium]|nr:sigma-70 family RNA polymerase sigma factor [Clostridia bacterium]
MFEKLIESIFDKYQKHGFVTEDSILQEMQENNISLFDIDRILDLLLAKGVIVRDAFGSETTNSENADDDYDRSQTDYENVFQDILNLDGELETLINSVRNIQPPQHREWVTLLPQAQAGNTFARNRIFEMYMRSVLRLALQFSNRYDQPIADTIQNGFIGLYVAIDKFEYGKQDNFPQYYPLWVIQHIRREAEVVNPTVYYPVHMKDKLFSCWDAVNTHQCEMCGTKNICPNLLCKIEEIVSCTEDEAIAIRSSLEPYDSLNDLIEQDKLERKYEIISEEEVYDVVVINEMAKQIRNCLKTLTSREEEILMLRYGFNDGIEHTLEDVGQKYNVTRERIRQIEAKAIRKLRHSKRRELLKDYL